MAKNEDVSVAVSRTGEAHVPHAKYEDLIAKAKQVQKVVTVSTAESKATRGVPKPACVNKSIAFCTISLFASRTGKM